MASHTQVISDQESEGLNKDIPLITQPTVGATSNDKSNVHVDLTEKERVIGVQSSVPNMSPGLIWHVTTSSERNIKPSFIFTCESCLASLPPRATTKPDRHPHLQKRVVSQPLPGPCPDKTYTNSMHACSHCAEVPGLKETVSQMSLQIRSLQLQLITLRSLMARQVNSPHNHGAVPRSQIPTS